MEGANHSIADGNDLERFVQAQQRDQERALSEIRSGRKRSRWMWYILPQFSGLGFSRMPRYYTASPEHFRF